MTLGRICPIRFIIIFQFELGEYLRAGIACLLYNLSYPMNFKVVMRNILVILTFYMSLTTERATPEP